MENLTEENLVRRCVAGEEPAWREFVSRYRPLLRRAARYYLIRRGIRRDDLEEEIEGEVLKSLVENDFHLLRSFRWECSLSSWLFFLVRSSVRDFLRNNRTLPSPEQLLFGISLSDDSKGPEKGLEERERRQLLQDALQKLPKEDRELLRLVYEEGRIYREIASRWNVSPKALSVRSARAKQKLLKYFEKGLKQFFLFFL